MAETSLLSRSANGWVLVERYVARYPHDWILIFKRNDEVLELKVPEEIWRAFDGINIGG